MLSLMGERVRVFDEEEVSTPLDEDDDRGSKVDTPMWFLASWYSIRSGGGGGSSSSSSSATVNENKLKQKKRLSFREPEVETPHNSSWSNSNRMQSKPSALLAATNADGFKQQSTSLEDLTLEDQTFIIAKQVGQAFDKRPCERRRLSITTVPKFNCSDYRTPGQNRGFLTETLQNDCSHIGTALQKNGTNSRTPLSPEDAQYFEALSPPILNMSAMKYPAIEVSESSVAKINQALVTSSTDIVSTSVQHQMQFLKYQLEQQRQQTQAALAHIQLLKDQLQAETSARYKAQIQNHQLIMQNKELLDHIQNLFRQIQDLEKHEQKPTFPSSQESQHETQVREAVTTIEITPPKNNGESKQTKPSIFAPNPILANRRRSSMTSLRSFQSKTSYLEPNWKRDEVRPRSRGSSPVPMRQIGNPSLPESSAETTKTNNPNGGRTFLFNSTQKYEGMKNSSKKEQHEEIKDNSTKELQNATKTSANLPGSSNPVSNLALMDTTKSNPKSLMNSELNFRDENLILRENPFFIQEKIPRKLESCNSAKNHASDPSPDCTGVSSVMLSPKSYESRSKVSKFYNNDNVLPLALDSTANHCIKENKRFSSGTSRLFNS